MLQITEKLVQEIQLENEFYIEIIEDDKDNNYTDFWLCKRGYGIKYQMFGLNNQNTTFQEMIEIVMYNIEEQINLHKEDFQ